MSESAKRASWQKAVGNSEICSPALKELMAAIYEPVVQQWWLHQPSHILNGQSFSPDFSGGKDEFLASTTAGKTGNERNNPESPAHRSEEQHDFLYTRVWSTKRADHHALFRKTNPKLKPGGIWLVAFMQLSEFMTYPKHYAFARTMELIGLLEEAGNAGTAESMPMSMQLKQTGFSLLNEGYTHPAFLQQGFNSIPSLFLNWYQADLLRLLVAKPAELDALQLELQQFDRAKNILISRPAIFQILAQKLE